jgi:hypothetical protein
MVESFVKFHLIDLSLPSNSTHETLAGPATDVSCNHNPNAKLNPAGLANATLELETITFATRSFKTSATVRGSLNDLFFPGGNF